tara:strand:- start:5106 stop:5891 length:786 start_codon:yes stop_codon:yes gene_type:complete
MKITLHNSKQKKDRYYINRYIPRRDWILFKRALENYYGSTYGKITTHLIQALNHYSKHLKKKEYSELKLIQNKNGKHIPIEQIFKEGEKLLNTLQKYAKLKGGHCTSKTCTNIESIISWECEKQHSWTMSAKFAKKGYWCPICTPFINETKARKLLEKILNSTFKKIRPNWLKNPATNQNLELDGYSPKLKIAFEYNGKQHYQPVDIFGGESSFKSQIRRDELKKQLCKNNNIKLIIIPYFWNGTESEIIKILQENGVLNE